MTTMNRASASRPTVSAAAVAPGSRLRAWRAVAALPAIAGSFLLLLVAFGWMGQWEGLVLAGWLALVAAAFTRAGERIAVAVGFGFRRPTSAQWAVLARLGTARSTERASPATQSTFTWRPGVT